MKRILLCVLQYRYFLYPQTFYNNTQSTNNDGILFYILILIINFRNINNKGYNLNTQL